ncbi:VOC family protein [Amycolatopsis endophytica]|uniref:Catechol 2,3-dioxygenase-like lactoylglutathione lyase family enzyme n=1 Tax=Amycolatopsis endophytica TaxID=860233 RepID=A0A853B9C0_9PSEU|nr:VOC family protein [Amycolatopsis endophytica]NYI91600.1 catechol 2,3-dioxygenase-like lactoylglutathione lyase family enzyme [Amycolatopsis endophytica]
MPLHRLTRVTIGVPNVEQTRAYYTEFGLTPAGHGLATTDGGEQLRIEHAPRRRLLGIDVGADDRDDLDRILSRLRALDLDPLDGGDHVTAVEPISGIRTTVTISGRISQEPVSTPYNFPGNPQRPDVRAPGVLREEAVRPRKLGHVVLGSTDAAATQRFFTEGIGFKVSDVVPGMAAFLRCSTDHHNLLVQQAPVDFLHHTSWQVDDVDEVGRGASAMLAADPGRHVWGLGRHHIGSNFFWYLKDPAGNFSEYYSDLDCIVDDALWKPGTFEGTRALFSWGPPPPPSFLAPEDLAAVMTGAHAPH